MIHSYEVPLVCKEATKASDGKTIPERSIDLLASSFMHLPIVIEAKFRKLEPTKRASIQATSNLFGQFMQGLSYAITLRYIWSKSLKFRNEWAESFDSAPVTPTDLPRPLPVILAANPKYWQNNYLWSANQQHWKDLCTLVKVAHNAGYPIYVGVIDKPVSPDTLWQFQVVAWDSLPTPTTNGPIQFPTESTS